jgi:F-type H+-transporting ATPase subunit delta
LSLEKIARRYAVALADAASSPGEAEAIQTELLQWESLMQANRELEGAFKDPTIPYDQKRNVLTQIIARTQPRETTANFLQVLLKNERMAALAEINKKFADVLNERAGVIAAQVTVARQVPETSKEALIKRLVELTGKRVRVTFAVDEKLIGGIVTRIGSTVYDGSVRNQLREIERALAGE